MYRGLPSTLYGIMPYVGFKMASYDVLMTFFKIDKNHPYAQSCQFIMGGAAGTISITLTYPTDLIRRKMQMVGTPGYPTYKGFVDCGVQVFK